MSPWSNRRAAARVRGQHEALLFGSSKSALKISLRALVITFVLSSIALTAHADDKAKKRTQAERLVTEFWERVWSPPPDLRAIEDLVVEDFVLTSAGTDVKGRDAFKAWIKAFQKKAKDIQLEAFETFSNADATRVTSRWRAKGINNGVLGTEPDGRPITFTGIAIWEVRWTPDGPKLAHNWLERSAWELYQQLTTLPP